MLVQEDMANVVTSLGPLLRRFEGARILVTGHSGFVGSNMCALLAHFNQNTPSPAEVTCIDSKIVDLQDNSAPYTKEFRVITGNSEEALDRYSFDYVIHCAGIASPTFYRKFPLETIKVNAISYWDLLQKMDADRLKGFLYFSTSEIYGNPDPAHVPTDESYWGRVSCTGPRSCYDESKRLGETISISFAREKGLPIKIVRPFNVFGPFMRLDDKRVIPDFAKSGLEKRQIIMFSDGSPTRSFCYSSDAIDGFLRVLLDGEPGRPYNIGNDSEEVSMLELAGRVAKIIGGVSVERKNSADGDYLTDNPQRRRPNISRATQELGFSPKVSLDDGLRRTVEWYQQQASI